MSLTQESSSLFLVAIAFAIGCVLSICCHQQTAEWGYYYTLILINILAYLDMASCCIPKPENHSLAILQIIPKSLIKSTTSGSVSHPPWQETTCHLSPAFPYSLLTLLPLLQIHLSSNTKAKVSMHVESLEVISPQDPQVVKMSLGRNSQYRVKCGLKPFPQNLTNISSWENLGK